jgi:hypothetical protein
MNKYPDVYELINARKLCISHDLCSTVWNPKQFLYINEVNWNILLTSRIEIKWDYLLEQKLLK